jgi:hypothetical protein
MLQRSLKSSAAEIKLVLLVKLVNAVATPDDYSPSVACAPLPTKRRSSTPSGTS